MSYDCCRSRGEFERAEPLLVDAYKMYKHERWTLLATQCLVNLSRCQKQLKHMDKYLFLQKLESKLSVSQLGSRVDRKENKQFVGVANSIPC